MNITPKNTKDFKTRFLVLYMVLLSPGCFDEDSENVNLTSEQENELKNKVLNLETEIKVLKWENTRLSLKLRSVDGSLLVRDKKTNLWHYDVERTPYTGIATENFQSGRPRAEASFYNGKRDGISRYWHENGNLKSEEQWFDGKEDGLIREWNAEGRLIKVLRYKTGELIEIIGK